MRSSFPQGYSNILALGAHPDDIELGCGGSLVRLRKSGAGLHGAVFSRCSDESPEDTQLRVREYEGAARVIGIAAPLVYDYPNRQLPEYGSQIMADMERLQFELTPDLVFIPFLDDPHQDHEAVAKAALRVFR